MKLGKFEIPNKAVDTIQGAVETRLPKPLRQQMERAFQTDFSTIKVYESHLPTLNSAKAIATGNDVHFAPGTIDFLSQAGEKHVAHELAHVVQQRQGRVVAQVQNVVGQAINDGAGLEQAADAMGLQALGL